MSVFDKFKKSVEKEENISFDGATPTFWVSFGNYVINKIMTGKYKRGIPQGRITGLAGPSSAGKSFIVANAIKAALEDGCLVMVLDSEHSLDDEYLKNIGVTDELRQDNYLYVSVSGVSGATKAFNKILTYYKEEKKEGRTPQKLLLVLDSIDFLFVNSAIEKYEKEGELSSDQGLQAKSWKQMLGVVVQDIKHIPVAVLCTKQVYVDQTPYAFPPWKMTESIRFALSQTCLITKLMEKDKTTKVFDGIKLRVFGWKTRFTKPYQQCEILVPYDKGLDPYEGLLLDAVSNGVVKQGGSWYTFGDEKFQKSKMTDDLKSRILDAMVEIEDNTIVNIVESEDDLSGLESENDFKKKMDEKKKSMGLASTEE